MLQPQARVDRVVRIVEPEQQAVAQFLDDARGYGQCGPDHRFLALEQGQGHVVAVHVGQRGEPDDVGEDDGAVVGHQALDTRIAPLTLMTAISNSSPSVRSQSMRPLRDRRRVDGRVAAGTRISTLPDTVCTARRSPPTEPINTLPLTVLISAPRTCSSNTTPETPAIVA